MKQWTRHLLFLENDNQVIVGNKRKCTYLKISRECYDILVDIVNNAIEVNAFNNIFEQKEDKEYFEELYKSLIDKKILVDRSDKELIERIGIQWEITNYCNLHCKHCIADAMSTNRIQFDKRKIFSIANRILELTPSSLTLTGGEPMLLPFFFELAQHIRNNYSKTLILMTNAIFISENNAKEIANIFDKVFISIDGVDEVTCSAVRGKGVFEKVLNAIKYLKKYDVREISLSMVLTTDNMSYKKRFEEMCNELGVISLLRSFAVEGRGANHKGWYISSEEIKEDEITNEQYDFICKKKKEQPILEYGACDGRYGSFAIKENGDVYPCAAMNNQKKLCNLLEVDGDIRDYFYAEKYKNTQSYRDFEKKMPENSEKCKECNVNYFCWHCPFINAQAVLNDKFYDNRCKSNKRDLSAALWGEI